MTFKGTVPRRGGGFTLVELLVVIGIIALLIAILMPALARSRESANRLKCQAQLRNIGQAFQLHANEHRGYYPVAGWHWEPDGGVADPKGLLDPEERLCRGTGGRAVDVEVAHRPQRLPDLAVYVKVSVQACPR